MAIETYNPQEFYDELFEAPSTPREHVSQLINALSGLGSDDLERCEEAATLAMRQMGITFTVYGLDEGTERIIPFDIVPRVLAAQEWAALERGLKQRIMALNLFVSDIYGEQRILRDGAIPKELVLGAKSFRKECVGLRPPKDIWCHITGTDLVRDGDGQFYVLEDNLRCPSGISYVLENRRIQKQIMPQVFKSMKIRAIVDYPYRLLKSLEYSAPVGCSDPTIAVLTPGIYNSAYFEHSYLASQMGVMLVEGRDLVVANDFLYMRTTEGLKRVDVLYRRIDDDFLDPKTFRPDSVLGVPGIMDVYRKGHLSLANATGTGIADDKAIYAYVPKIIKYYLGEEILLPNVPTFLCSDEKECQHVLANLDQLVVKSVNESGGYGMLVGPHASSEEREAFAEKIRTTPRDFVAQPTLSLSRVPTLVEGDFEGRHVDLRPYILYGEEIYVQPGGLTRVALRKGSLVVNSSQGGGTKDTWVMEGSAS